MLKLRFLRKIWPLGFVVFAVLPVLSIACGGGGPPVTKPSIVIASSPESGATIIIDDVVVGETPKRFEGYEGKGIVVVLRKENFKDKKEFIRVPEDGEHRFVIDIEPRVGYITIESRPPGALVYLNDDIILGETSLVRISVPIGVQSFTFTLNNYQKSREEKEIKEDYRYTLLSVLKPVPARISILTQPTGASIIINDELQVETSPTQFELPPGEYTIGVYLKGYIAAEESHVITANQKLDMSFKLEAGQTPRGMVIVPAGEFIMGTDARDPDERPRRKIMLDSFYIDKYEVTNAQYRAQFPRHSFETGLEKFPVSGVTWRQATAYAQAVGKRLPTEAEWEKAARGTEGMEYSWGDSFEESRCNSGEEFDSRLEKIGQYRTGASPYNCMDMAGNVLEWTASWYGGYPGNRDELPTYGQVFRVLRGGSYLSKKFDVRCASRAFDKEDKAKPVYGFRCAKDVE